MNEQKKKSTKKKRRKETTKKTTSRFVFSRVPRSEPFHPLVCQRHVKIPNTYTHTQLHTLVSKSHIHNYTHTTNDTQLLSWQYLRCTRMHVSARAHTLVRAHSHRFDDSQHLRIGARRHTDTVFFSADTHFSTNTLLASKGIPNTSRRMDSMRSWNESKRDRRRPRRKIGGNENDDNFCGE